MNNQARGCELKCKYNIQGICHAYGECIAKDLFIAELEKIKAEIMSIGNWREICEVPNGYVVECLNIINKHISELKGEQECTLKK